MVRDAKLGPRRELVLQIETWPRGKVTFGGGDIVVLRFGAIEKFDEVRRLSSTHLKMACIAFER